MSHGLTTALRGAARSAARRRPALRRALIADRPPATAGDCVAISPLWARVYREYSLAIPEHRGKDRLLRALHERGVRSDKPFAYLMRNGAWRRSGQPAGASQRWRSCCSRPLTTRSR